MHGIIVDDESLIELLRSLSVVIENLRHEFVAGFMKETLYQPTHILTDMHDVVQTNEIV